MRGHRDNFLLDKHGTADRAMLALRQARLCARGRDRFVDHLGMRGHCDRFRIAVAAGAGVGHLAFLRASRLPGDSRSICMLMRRLGVLIGIAGSDSGRIIAVVTTVVRVAAKQVPQGNPKPDRNAQH